MKLDWFTKFIGWIANIFSPNTPLIWKIVFCFAIWGMLTLCIAASLILIIFGYKPSTSPPQVPQSAVVSKISQQSNPHDTETSEDFESEKNTAIISEDTNTTIISSVTTETKQIRHAVYFVSTNHNTKNTK